MGDAGLATVQAQGTIAVGVGIRRKPQVQLSGQQPVEQVVHDALLPGRNVERPALAIKVVLQGYGGTEVKLLVDERPMDGIQTAESAPRQIVKRTPVRRGGKCLA